MRKRPAIAGVSLALALLLAGPTRGAGARPCPQSSPTTASDRLVHLRAVLSALVPAVYIDVQSTHLSKKRRRGGLSPPDRSRQSRPELGRWNIESERDTAWEIGLMWDPVRLVRRTREASRFRSRYLRDSPPRLDGVCPSSAGEVDGNSDGFESRLDRAADRQKRRSLENLLD